MVTLVSIIYTQTYPYLGRQRLPEQLLLRDTLYLLQGISGKHVRFSGTDDPDPLRKLIFVDDPVCLRTLYCFVVY